MDIKVHVVVPAGIDDPARPSGGNRYDRRLFDGLAATGWTVVEHPIPGSWPVPADADRAVLAAAVDGLPDGALVLVDGLIGAAAADVLVPAAGRLQLLVLVHLPLAVADGSAADSEAGVLRAAAGVICTSDWTRHWLEARYGLPRAVVATPGVDPAELVDGTVGGGRLLCVGAVQPHKGQDVLITALADLADLSWHCRLVGAVDLDPAFVAGLRRRIAAAGIADRVPFTGPLAGRAIEQAYAAADLLVVPSRIETYGMVVVESLARGIPVAASDVGGVRESLGTIDGDVPALLLRAGDADALAAALRRWLTSPEARADLLAAAARRRPTLPSWTSTVTTVGALLAEVAAGARERVGTA